MINNPKRTKKSNTYECELEARKIKVLASITEVQKLIVSLNMMVTNDMMTLEEAKTKEVTVKEKRIRTDFGIDTDKIGSYDVDHRAYIHIGAKLRDELSMKTDTVTARNREELILKLYELLYGNQSDTLNSYFEQYRVWRFNVGTRDKTLKEDGYAWNRFFRDNLGKSPATKITIAMVRDQFLKMTSGNAITRKCFNSAKSVLKGVFQYCVEQEIIDSNPVDKINYNQFSKRFKPETSKKDYSRDEVATIVCSLRSSEDIYDYAIRFAFNTCIRFGELRSIKFSDMKDGFLTISRSSSDINPAVLDDEGHLTFSSTITEETYTKGATSEGIRDFPLTTEAQEIINELHEKYPDNEYIFMSNGARIKNVTFNRHLKKVCEDNGIEYRSSHTIRFTNCDTLFNIANVSKQSLQGYMGHSTPSMTDHYIALHRAKDDDNEKVLRVLKIV